MLRFPISEHSKCDVSPSSLECGTMAKVWFHYHQLEAFDDSIPHMLNSQMEILFICKSCNWHFISLFLKTFATLEIHLIERD